MAKKKAASANPPVPLRKVTFEGATYHLPIIGPGRNITKAQKVKVAKVVCEMYATGDYTVMECLKHCGINSDNTWSQWCKIAEIGELYNSAISSADTAYRQLIKKEARRGLLKAIQGYSHTTIERLGEVDIKGKVTTVAVKEKELYIRPNMRAIEFGLTNVDGRNFTRAPEPYKSGNESIPQEVRIINAGQGKPPVTREEDIEDL